MDTSKLLRKGETVKDVSGAEITVLDTALDFNQRLSSAHEERRQEFGRVDFAG